MKLAKLRSKGCFFGCEPRFFGSFLFTVKVSEIRKLLRELFQSACDTRAELFALVYGSFSRFVSRLYVSAFLSQRCRVYLGILTVLKAQSAAELRKLAPKLLKPCIGSRFFCGKLSDIGA